MPLYLSGRLTCITNLDGVRHWFLQKVVSYGTRIGRNGTVGLNGTIGLTGTPTGASIGVIGIPNGEGDCRRRLGLTPGLPSSHWKRSQPSGTGCPSLLSGHIPVQSHQ